MSLALSLADADRDGDLDVALGNWAAGWYRRVPGEESRNRILWNEDGTLTGESFTDLPAIPGETLSILFSDIDRDGASDLLVGNDFEIPDAIYFGDGARGFRQITHQDGLIPQTTTTTMAIKSDDLTGNGIPEIYLAQIAGRSSGVSETLKMQPLELYCDASKTPRRWPPAARTWRSDLVQVGQQFRPDLCRPLSGTGRARSGRVQGDAGQGSGDPAEQSRHLRADPANQPVARSYCDLHFLPARAITAAEAEASIQQILRSNVLLEATGTEPGGVRSTGYADTAETRGLDVGGWSWDTKVEDFDLDGRSGCLYRQRPPGCRTRSAPRTSISKTMAAAISPKPRVRWAGRLPDDRRRRGL